MSSLAMYRWMRDYFVNVKGLHNILWTIEGHIGVHRPSGTASAGASIDYYYPGDDAIDLVGFSAYISGWNPGFDADAPIPHSSQSLRHHRRRPSIPTRMMCPMLTTRPTCPRSTPGIHVQPSS